ncbi:MAG: hypothetical protein JNM30_10240 [Rhodospirillales bacterium]|nr:hypothetical protein [Rhodospirillales bacterium]
MTQIAAGMITQLHWVNFESMVDLIFARSGWQRVSRLGETQADVDLVLALPTTGQRAFVKVKRTPSTPTKPAAYSIGCHNG